LESELKKELEPFDSPNRFGVGGRMIRLKLIRVLVLFLLVVGCAPIPQFSDRPDLRFVGIEGAKSYTVYIYSSRAAIVRQIALKAPGIATEDASCVTGVEEDSHTCGEGRAIMAAPGGYRLALTADELPVGNACVAQGGFESLQFCADLVWLER
jgi:hypothetical protein